MSGFTLRVADTADIDRIVELRKEFLGSVGRTVDDELRTRMDEYLKRAIPSGQCVFWIGVVNGRTVATGAMCIYERLMWDGAGREGYVISMYTEPPHRGNGIATAIVEEMQAFARAEHLKLCLIAIDEARPLYDRAGFQGDHRYMRWR